MLNLWIAVHSLASEGLMTHCIDNRTFVGLNSVFLVLYKQMEAHTMFETQGMSCPPARPDRALIS